jgi:hypothetical protein
MIEEDFRASCPRNMVWRLTATNGKGLRMRFVRGVWGNVCRSFPNAVGDFELELKLLKHCDMSGQLSPRLLSVVTRKALLGVFAPSNSLKHCFVIYRLPRLA